MKIGFVGCGAIGSCYASYLSREHEVCVLDTYTPVIESIKKNGIYEEVTGLLRTLSKEVVEFTGIMANPTYAKVQEGAKLAKENAVDYILAVGGGSVIDCCKIVAAQTLTANSEADIQPWLQELGLL